MRPHNNASATNNVTATKDAEESKARLHLLIPATASNKNLCRLLLSAAVLNYPVPTLINWGTKESEDPYVQHLLKVEKTLRHLKTLPSDNVNDLVLVVDGYDVSFQLRSDVLIRRYFAINEAANQRVASALGSDIVRQHDIRQTVIFGPDSICWPYAGGRRPACWAVPQSTLPNHAFGPYDDTELKDAMANPVHARPRWLNSGTIMGTVGDVRAVLEGTLDLIHENHTTDSDQWYFAQLFGIQEYTRELLKPSPSLPDTESIDIPQIKPGQKTEFHVGLDYESAIFQPVGYNADSLRWLWFDSLRGAGKEVQSSVVNVSRAFELPDDIITSPSPFSAVQRSHWVTGPEYNHQKMGKNASSLPLDLSWKDLPLAINIVTKQTFALIHYMQEKNKRDPWWKMMWFYPYAKALLAESVKAPKAPIIDTPVDGRIWWKAGPPHLAKPVEAKKSSLGGRGGAWSDKGSWLPWDGFCKVYDVDVFGTKS